MVMSLNLTWLTLFKIDTSWLTGIVIQNFNCQDCRKVSWALSNGELHFLNFDDCWLKPKLRILSRIGLNRIFCGYGQKFDIWSIHRDQSPLRSFGFYLKYFCHFLYFKFSIVFGEFLVEVIFSSGYGEVFNRFELLSSSFNSRLSFSAGCSSTPIFSNKRIWTVLRRCLLIF